MKIKNKLTSEVILGTGFDQINNQIRWQKEDSNGEVSDSGLIYCPELWAQIESYQIIETNVIELTQNISTTCIFNCNLFDLNLEEWELV